MTLTCRYASKCQQRNNIKLFFCVTHLLHTHTHVSTITVCTVQLESIASKPLKNQYQNVLQNPTHGGATRCLCVICHDHSSMVKQYVTFNPSLRPAVRPFDLTILRTLHHGTVPDVTGSCLVRYSTVVPGIHGTVTKLHKSYLIIYRLGNTCQTLYQNLPQRRPFFRNVVRYLNNV